VSTGRTYVEPAKELPVYGEYDVIIVGGGAAGFAAAVAAARNGAKTLIIERFPFFGGTATAAIMPQINGFRNEREPDGLQTTRGIGEEVILRLKELGGLGITTHNKQKVYPTAPGQLSFSYGVDTEKLKYAMLKMVTEAGAEVLFHTYFCDVIREGRRVVGVIWENKSGRQAAYAKVIIDASGDGDVAIRAGAAYWQTVHDEAPRLIDILIYKVAGLPNEHHVHGAGVYSAPCLWGPKAGPINAVDARELTDAEIRTRLAVYEDLKARKAHDPQLADAEIVETGPMLGIRQTRFIEGLYKITAEDVLGGARFEDSMAMASKPIIHYYGYRRFLEHEGYEIPYRCMLPKDVDGMLVAGRCMSSDQPAFESWRSIGPCMCLGQAAGTSAALCARAGVEPKQVDIKALQRTLIEQGAEIGQGRRRE